MMEVNFKSSAFDTKEFLDLMETLKKLTLKMSEDMVLIRVDVKAKIILGEVD